MGLQPRYGQSDAAVIVATDNGGATWTNSSVPNYSPGIGSVACVNTAKCIAVGGTVLVSNDSGKTWTNKTVAGGTSPLMSIACSTPLNCIAIGPNPAGRQNSASAGFGIATSDGANSFSQLKLPPSSAYLQNLSCSANFCTAVGQDPTKNSSSLEFSTSDNGSTWSAGPQIPHRAILQSVECQNITACIAVGESPSGPLAYSISTAGVVSKAVMP